MNANVLIVDSNVDCSNSLAKKLAKDDYNVEVADCMIHAVSRLRENLPDLMLVNSQLPEVSAAHFISQIRASAIGDSIAVIVMVSFENEIIDALSNGADDCVEKQSDYYDYLSKIRLVLNRKNVNRVSDERITAGEISLDPKSRQVRVGGDLISLTLKEYRILLLLLSSGGKIMTRSQILIKAFGGEKAAQPRLVDVHIASLRNKLGIERGMVETIHGVGYKLSEPQHSQI